MSSSGRRFYLFASLICTLFFGAFVDTSEAGFGITPPYVTNSSLTRNSTYEQEILLVRSDPNSDQKAEVTIDAPDLDGWIEIVEGTDIFLPKNQQKVPMTVRVTVPADAKFQDYSGKIRIRTLPADGQVAPGTVSISLGALVDINLSVIDKKIKDFRVRKISVPDLNAGKKLAWLFFPGKIRFDMMIENTGNVDIAPSKVLIKIYDLSGRSLLEETRNIGRIKKIEPYQTETVTAELPTRLPEGSYLARYQVFNGDDIKQEGDVSLNILKPGTLEVGGFGFLGLSLPHKISLLLPIFSVIIAFLYFLHYRRRAKQFAP